MNTTFEEKIIFDQFDKWADSLERFEDEETLQKFLDQYGAARHSMLANLFIAFLGGMNAGLDLAGAMYQYSNEKK